MAQINSGHSIPNYLRRIGFHSDSEIALTIETVNQLHELHLKAIPFENLDIFHKVGIQLDADKIYEKVVGKNRGGFCYELNTLFYVLLKQLGFDVQLLSGQVAKRKVGFGPKYDHLAILLTIDSDQWICDVGFGDFVIHPLAFNLDVIQQDRYTAYRILKLEEQLFLIQHMGKAGQWRDSYKFNIQAEELNAFESMCRYHQTSPESHFTQGVICSRLTDTGRVTLTKTNLIITSHGVKDIYEIDNDVHFDQQLLKYFNIVL